MKKQKLKLRLLPVIAFTAVVLLIVKAHTYSVDINDMPNIPIDSSMVLWDVFYYVKSSAILIISIWAGLTMAFLLITGQMKIKKTNIYIPMLVYTLAVVISYIVSQYQSIAWIGNVDRFEGTRTLLCYMFMLFYTVNVVDDIRDIVIILSAAVTGAFIACLIGFTQLIGHDFYLTKWGNVFVTGGSHALRGEFQTGRVYQTVANMNYVGMYLALIVPVLIYSLWYLNKVNNRQALRSVGIDNKKRIAMVVFIIIELLLIVLNVYGANSTGSILGICASVGGVLIVFLDKKWQKITLAGIFAAGLFGVLAFIYVQGEDTHKQLDYIETGIDCINLSLDGNKLRILYDRRTDSFVLKDNEEYSISTFVQEWDDGLYQVDDARFVGKIELLPFKDDDGETCIAIGLKDDSFGFTFYEGGVKYMNPFGWAISLEKIKSMGFSGHLAAGSGRAYIWSRTIPLIMEKFFWGYGADTFMLVFPQEDYAGKYSAGTPLSVTCEKPHNLYLCMAVGTGMISLIAFIVLVGMTLWRVFHQGRDKRLVKILAAGIIGFLFAGFFNDSSVCTMPMFYGLLGTVIAMCV